MKKIKDRPNYLIAVFVAFYGYCILIITIFKIIVSIIDKSSSFYLIIGADDTIKHILMGALLIVSRLYLAEKSKED